MQRKGSGIHPIRGAKRKRMKKIKESIRANTNI